MFYQDEKVAMFFCNEENLSQGEAGNRLLVSRGTVQCLLAQVRGKTIESVVLGMALLVKREIRDSRMLEYNYKQGLAKWHFR